MADHAVSSSTAHPSPNPLPTSSPTSTYPSSPPPSQSYSQAAHPIYGYTTILDPLSPPRAEPLFESPDNVGVADSPFLRLEVPSATDEQWREWERVTKEAMDQFDHERAERRRREDEEGEEISFGGGEPHDRADDAAQGVHNAEEGGIRIVR